MMLTLGLFEVFWVSEIHDINIEDQEVIWFNVFETFQWGIYVIGFFLIVQFFMGLVLPKLSYFLLKLILSLLVIFELGLIFYFSKTLVPLGSDLFAYSVKDLYDTVAASGALNYFMLIGLAGLILVIYLLLEAGKIIPYKNSFVIIFSGLTYFLLLFFYLLPELKAKDLSEIENNLSQNKSLYFYEATYNYFSTSSHIYFDFYLSNEGNKNQLVEKEFTNSTYPFLHKNKYPDVLGPFFHEFDTLPDIVFVLVEGLGKAYSGKNAYLGSFTPFLDSLAEKSLNWENNLSTTGRTFGVLPGIFGSLPFGKHGFQEAMPFPDHYTLLSLLKANGYQVNYFIGADKNFDNVGPFLNYQNVDQLIDMGGFDPDFSQTPSSSGFSWGYPDKALFQNGLRHLPETEMPQLNIFQTQSSHDPFVLPNQGHYNQKFNDFLRKQGYTHSSINHQNYQKELASILYVDEAIKAFFEEYMKRPGAENSVFIITGDHRLPEIPISTKIDRFHVPLIIYSPKLKQGRTMNAVNTHFEITPTLLSFLENQYPLELPENVAWRGYVLDTAVGFQSRMDHALMRNKNQLMEYIDGEYFLSNQELYKIQDQMGLTPLENERKFDQLQIKFNDFKSKNNYAMSNNRIIPPEESELTNRLFP
ncbi:LTA synthase family protein [Echinicola jeungdonensis]|uniref:LTA synthase family protein n=1 Tax=Echinicola jeungdonensis TaxID=709343 RepID=A0ABV5J5C3_9BACT|nr:LTA synthase family protein [Echinicola jeungdonensis]MDN3670837.1 LTA synthase family protein [Echinicola jeungdonensis]